MPRAKTNVSATRAAVRAMHKTGRLGPELAGVEQLALSLATALDSVLLDPEQKKYVITGLARAHLLVQQALLAGLGNETLDPFAAFVAGLATPNLTTDSDL